MTDEQITVKLTDHDHEIGSLKHRMRDVETANAALTRLAMAVEVMATKQDTISESVDRLTGKVEAVEVMATKQDTMWESVDRLTGKVDALEAKPARRWDGLVDKLLFAAAGAVVAWIAAGAPGM